jgi:hypothetical protein
LIVPRIGYLTKIDLGNGNLVTQFAGNGAAGNLVISDGQNISAVFSGAMRCQVDNQGNIYVADMNNAIRMVNQTGYVTTITTGPPNVPLMLPLNNETILFATYNPPGIYNLNLQTKQTVLSSSRNFSSYHIISQK